MTFSLLDRLTQPNCDTIEGLESVSMQENGAQGRNRTADTGIFNPLLYRLSYLAEFTHVFKLAVRK